MKRKKFSIIHKDEEMLTLMKKTDQKTLALWAIDCAERVIPYFEDKYPDDNRPRKALEAGRAWRSGDLKMMEARKAAFAAHAAARATNQESEAQSAARSAGHAAATAHLPGHSIAAANYAQQAIYRATNFSHADAAVIKERDWQYRHLLELKENS